MPDRRDAAAGSPEERLARYRDLVGRYHPALDLVSRRALDDLDRLIDEAGKYATLIERLVGPAPCVVDVGSGAGLPGVVVAVAMPAASVHLVERRRRRAAFLELVVAQLGLANARVFAGDVRALDDVVADVVTAQAVASLRDLASLTEGVRGPACWLVSRRGPGWREGLVEPADLPGRGAVEGPEAPEAVARRGVPAGPAAHAQTGWAATQVVEEELGPRGSLVAIRLPGGSACRSSA